jgi:predicted deacylase
MAQSQNKIIKLLSAAFKGKKLSFGGFRDLVEGAVLRGEGNIIILSGIHGDEPAGNIAAELFRGTKGVKVISGINRTGKRRIDGKDPNRHFGTPDEGELQENILNAIFEDQPRLVISLHEDNESTGMYAYSSKTMAPVIAKVIKSLDVPIISTIHGDAAKDGVISGGKQPFRGTLERTLRSYSIPYCTLETPTCWDLKVRSTCLSKAVSGIIEHVRM